MATLAEARDDYHELLLGPHRASTIEAIQKISRTNRIASPRLLARSALPRLYETTRTVVGALQHAADRLSRDPSLRRTLGFPAHLEPMIALDHDRDEWSYAARLDAFIGTDGELRFLEYNPETAGQAFVAEVMETFERLPIAAEFARRHPFRTFDLYRVTEHKVLSGRSAPPVIGVMGTQELATDLRWIPHVAARAGWPVVHASPADFRFEGGKLLARDQIVELVVIADWADLAPGMDGALRVVLEAVRAGAARLPYGVARYLMAGAKCTFEVLSSPDYEHLFDVETNRALRRHVPWTRVLRDRRTVHDGREIDLLPYITDHRDRFVIKPSGANSGAGVVLGWDCTDDEWKHAIKISRVLLSVVQERVDEGALEPYFELSADGALTSDQFTVDFDPFVWPGRDVEGAVSRVARAGRHNFAAGAWVAPTWIVDE